MFHEDPIHYDLRLNVMQVLHERALSRTVRRWKLRSLQLVLVSCDDFSDGPRRWGRSSEAALLRSHPGYLTKIALDRFGTVFRVKITITIQ